MSADQKCFVEFAVDSEDRFAALCAVFAALKHDKDEGAFRDTTDWVEFFDDETLARFWWPTSAELAAYMAKWEAASVERRLSDVAFFPSAWEFESLFEAFANGEFELRSCRRTEADRARMEFEAQSYPYGGTGCMRGLIEVFGFRVIGENDGTGFYDYSQSVE